MKNILALALLIGFASCSTNGGDDLESKKALLSEKKAELQALEQEINLLSKEIKDLEPVRKKPATPVEVLEINPKDFTRFVEVQGRVEADDFVNVSSEIGGRITSLLVEEGDYVRKGQLLATTDLETVEKQIAEIETQLELANTVYERQKRLWDQNIGSEIQYLEAKTRMEGLEKSLETLESQISKKNIYAPIGGYVDREFLQEGETASPGMPIIQILNTAEIKVTADIQENFLSAIEKGDSVTVRFPALNLSIDETVTQLGRTIDLNNRTFEIQIKTSSRSGQLKPNLLAVIRFKDFQAEDIISVPLDAIHEEVNGNKFVYIVNEESGRFTAKKSYVELGESNVNEVIIASGVRNGDRLITKGSKGISQGELVRINS
ncbi:MAG: efflux RND transporter periplasmic adaptor subunit [Saprospiraceae bacterium]|nr:efflux RND transporter periplasmic adaptor subunit [Chitinophagia bacterium]